MTLAKIPIPLLVLGGLSLVAVTGFLLYFDPGGFLSGGQASARSVTLRLRLLDGRGVGVPGALVVAIPVGRGSRRSLPATDADGRTAAAVRPGRYNLMLTPKGLTTQAARLEFFAQHDGDTNALETARILIRTVEIGASDPPPLDLRASVAAGY